MLNFNEFATLENVESELLLQFDNNSNSVDLNTFDWAGILRTKLAGLPCRNNIPQYIPRSPTTRKPDRDTSETIPIKKCRDIPLHIFVESPHSFKKKTGGKLGERVTEIIGQKLNYTIIDSRFPSISREIPLPSL